MRNQFSLMRFITLFFVSFSVLFLSPAVFAIGNSIVAVDTAGITGEYTSLVLDAKGFPTMSYYDRTEGKLKIAHCFEKNCAFFNSILTPDAATNIGQYTSIALDSNGKPVVSYYDVKNSALKVLHCGNTVCSNGNTIAAPDTNGTVGQYTSVTVDKNNFPVVTYYDATSGVLKVLHCGNASCTGGNSIVKPDTATSNGVQSSVKMNAAGNPVIAYFDFTKKSLKMLTCGNANCNAGNTINTADSGADVGRFPSLVLDSNGKPAVSYLDLTNGKLKVLRCGNATCSAGNAFASIGTNGVVGYYSSLALDTSDNPMVSYYDRTNGKLNMLRCGNATCTSGNTITVPDVTGNVGLYTSMKLDASGNPVVSYFDASNGDLKVLHCGSATCGPNTVVTADASPKVGQYTAIKLDALGYPVVTYWDETNGDLKLLHCGNSICTANNTITSPYTTGNTGWDTSLALDAIGNPVISFFDFSTSVMKVMHCNNATCAGVNPVNTPDILSRRASSIALDAMGNPVVASAGQSDQGLRIVHCGDALCSANNSITSPDFPVYPAQADVRGVSLVLDAVGNPVVSFYRADKNQLKILHCADTNCSINAGNTITVVDPGAQAADHRATSITLDASGNPVVAYQDSANQALKVLHCGNASCTAGNTIASPATGPSVGSQPSIKIDAATGRPIVSFGSFGAVNNMSVLYCGNAACTAGNVITVVDPTTSGWDSALALDANNNPVASYYNSTGKNLKVLHCATKSCQ
ncbi:MAG: hypothetical protein P4M12_05900 [Gammaproteobacteria bacterium]|nr:hypothetical protein [Gammaproteobacteria bacterium]